MTRILLLSMFVLAGCPGSGGSSDNRRPPRASETPPTSHDPGAVMDDQHLQESTPPPEQGSHQHGIAPRADGQSCLAAAECTSGVCEGQGCGAGVPGTCMPKNRACTRDLRPYCDCNGKTFRTSGSCPGQRYASRGECTPP